MDRRLNRVIDGLSSLFDDIENLPQGMIQTNCFLHILNEAMNDLKYILNKQWKEKVKNETDSNSR